MAKTAVVTLSPSTAVINQPVSAVVTVTNGDGTDVNVTGVTPTAFATGLAVATGPISCGAGDVPLPIGSTVNVANTGGTLAIPYSMVFFAPSTASTTYSCGAYVSLSDGTLISATIATVTIAGLS